MPFDFYARRIFLTYPQSDALSKEIILGAMREWGCTRAVCGREAHADGGVHFHALGEWPNKFRTRNERFFDIGERHPNISTVRNINDVYNYVVKDGDFQGDNFSVDGDGKYRDLLATANPGEFWTLARTKYARDVILHHKELEYACEKLFVEPEQVYQPRYAGFLTPTQLGDWVADELRGKKDRPKSLILIGASRLGKTEWARSLDRHVYWNGSIDLKSWDASANYLVLDDFEKYIPYWKQFIGAQQEFTLTDKYRRKTTIKWGKPTIILANPGNDPRDFFNRRDREWLEMNTVVVELETPLFEENVWVEI